MSNSSAYVKKASNGKRFILILLVCCLVFLAAVIAFAASRIYPKLKGRYTYPRAFESEVLSVCDELSLDPDLVLAVIRTESGFRENAVSRVGAKGLMQIMPDTADWVAGRLGFEHDEKRIFEPEYNIRIGCYLLSYLLDRYDGELTFALAAYNAGHSRVDSWLENDELFDGEKLNIPITETKNYVEKVLDAYEKYKNQRG